KLIRLKKDYDLNNWVQDQFIVLSSSNSIYMIEPLLLSNRKNNDYLEELNNVKFNGFSLKKNQVPFIFDGGNILIGDNFFFIGSDDFYKSQALFLENSDLKEAIKKYASNYNIPTWEKAFEDIFRSIIDSEKELIVFDKGTDLINLLIKF